MRLFIIIFTLLVGPSVQAQVTRQAEAPRCGARNGPSMEAFMVNGVFKLLTDDYWAATRAKAGMKPTAPSAPRGALTDNAACDRLRKALEREVGKDGIEVGDRSQLFFYTVGDYYAVYSHLIVDPTSGMEVHQRHPMRIYSKGRKPRLLMTVYM